MKWYQDLLARLVNEGTWIENPRTGKKCLTIINANFEWDCSEHKLPILTTKKVAYKPAIAEILGYLRGYTSAADFRALGTTTWDANANQNKAWLANPNREGEDDMGIVYGAVAQNWPWPYENSPYIDFIDTMKPVIDKIIRHEDDRGLIITFWNPGVFEYGCLRPCMHTWHFSIVNDTLFLNTYQRSADVPLGMPFNMIQAAFLLQAIAHIAGLKPGKVFMQFTNVHIYEDQLEGVLEQLKREPYEQSVQLGINPAIKSFEDLNQSTLLDFPVIGYDKYHPAIKFPFSE